MIEVYLLYACLRTGETGVLDARLKRKPLENKIKAANTICHEYTELTPAKMLDIESMWIETLKVEE